DAVVVAVVGEVEVDRETVEVEGLVEPRLDVDDLLARDVQLQRRQVVVEGRAAGLTGGLEPAPAVRRLSVVGAREAHGDAAVLGPTEHAHVTEATADLGVATQRTVLLGEGPG